MQEESEENKKTKTQEQQADPARLEDQGGGMDIDGFEYYEDQWDKIISICELDNTPRRAIKGKQQDIKGILMNINDAEDMKDQQDIEDVLRRISDEKPLFVDICSFGNHDLIIKQICKKQHERGRYYWIDDKGSINTNMIRGGKFVGDKNVSKISMFVDAIKKDGRWKDDQGTLTHPEEQFDQYWDDLSGRALDPALVQKARHEEMK